MGRFGLAMGAFNNNDHKFLTLGIAKLNKNCTSLLIPEHDQSILKSFSQKI